MPSPNYAQNKSHIYKWRANHLEKSREINRKSKARHDAWKKITKIYLHILLE
jgi:hypothetical protein